jgi:hypothetical protein
MPRVVVSLIAADYSMNFLKLIGSRAHVLKESMG